MSLTDYSALKTAVADYIARSDLTTVIPDFITQAESRINRTLRTWDMETSASITMSSGVGALPTTDYLEWISVTWTSTGSRTQDLRYVEPDSEEWRFRYRPNGDPALFTIIASNVRLKPVSAGNITLYYYQKLSALTTTTGSTTNWLLTKAPDVYLNYALAEASIYMKDEDRAQKYMGLAEMYANKLLIEGDTNKVGRRPMRDAETSDIASARNPATSGS